MPGRLATVRITRNSIATITPVPWTRATDMADAARHAHGRMSSLSEHIRRLWDGSGAAGAVARVMTLRALMLAINLGTGLLTAALLGAAGRGELAALIVAPQFLA